MCDWNDFEFNEPYDGEEISSVLGVPLPAQYIAFMKKHNGGGGRPFSHRWSAAYPRP